MPQAPLVLGLDLGTQSVRAALVDLSGTTVAYGVAPIDTRHPRPGWAEQDPAQWWLAAGAATQQALRDSATNPERVAGVGLDCTACTVVACKSDGAIIRPALLWMDQRAAAEAAELSSDDEAALRYVSGRLSPEWMLPKALWLKRHEPKSYEQSDYVVECTNWIMFMLTGEWTLSKNHCAVKWNYAGPDGGWPVAYLRSRELGDLIDKWPARMESLGARSGELSSSAARHLGLLAGTPVAQGGIDAYLGMIGLGATNDGDLALILGSSTCQLAQSAKGVFGSGWAGCYPDATVDGLYTLEAGQTATGSVIDWYRRHFAGFEQAQAAERGVSVFDVLDEKARAVAAGCEGIIVRDDWQGNRSPHKNPSARGAITGLTLSHGPGHVFRALYEATACGTRAIVEEAERRGVHFERVFAGGGGAKSRLWLQIHGDVLQKPIHVTKESESCALGAAMAAAVGAGCYQTFDEAARNMVAIDRIIEPETSTARTYDDVYARYLRLYDRLNRD